MWPGLLAADGVDIVNLFERLRSDIEGEIGINKNRKGTKLRRSYC